MTFQALGEAVHERISASASWHLNDLFVSLVHRQDRRVASALRTAARTDKQPQFAKVEEMLFTP